jgi:4-amino-4-deoxy-L-arabinose transferase-like glycosyltransferase
LPSIAAAAVAVATVFGAQVVLSRSSGTLPEGSRQAIAGGLLIAGALLFGAGTRRWADAAARLDISPGHEPASTAWAAPPSLPWLACAIALAAGATIGFAFVGETRMIVAAWIGGIAALFISQLRNAALRWPRITRRQRPYLAGLTALLIVVLVTRVYHLSTLPYNLDGDFASVGLEARALVAGQRQIFSCGWAGQPMIGYLPAALTMSLFGEGLAGLNASGVIEGLLLIVAVYLLGRDLFQPRVGLFAAALLTISHTHTAASRQPSYIDPVPLVVFAVYSLLIGLRENRGWALAASGILTALCLDVYFSGRIIVPLVGFLVFYLLLFNRRWLRQRTQALLLWGVAVVITCGPMLVVFARDTRGLTARTREVFIFSPAIIHHEQAVYHTETLAGILLEQARRSALMFHYYPDTGTQFWLHVPFLDPLAAALFTLGIGLSLWRWRRTEYALLLAWAALVLALGCFLTLNPPYWPHLIVLLPPAVLLAALALNALYELVPPVHRRARLLQAVGVVLLLAWVGAQNWKTYVTAKRAWATSRTRIARYVEAQPTVEAFYLVSNEFRFDDREFEFLVPGRLTGDLTPEQVVDANLRAAPTSLILTREQNSVLHRLQQQYPGGSVERHAGNDPNEVAFYVFRRP